MRRGDVKQYKIARETWALEYAAGEFTLCYTLPLHLRVQSVAD